MTLKIQCFTISHTLSHWCNIDGEKDETLQSDKTKREKKYKLQTAVIELSMVLK